MKSLLIRSMLFCAPLFLAILGDPLMAQNAEVQQISRFSGKPLPRFESLRYSAVHGRKGPTLDHPIVWRYERTGLPMLVIRETHGWRRVRDVDGDEVWMQARMLSETRTAILLTEAVLHRKPSATSAAKAKLMEGLVAQLRQCQQGWCQIEIEHKTGWVKRDALWGTETATGSV